MKKIVVFNQKGGTGKTSCTVNISGCLDAKKKKVLVLDFDSQMNCTNYLLTQNKETYAYNICDCIKGESSFENTVLQVKLEGRKSIDTNIYVLPGSRELDTFEMNDIFSIKNLLMDEESNYDFCLIDCPPHISDFTISALACADFVLVPAVPDTDSLCGYDLLVDTVNNIRSTSTNVKIKILGIFFNNAESSKALDRFIMDECKEGMGDTIFKTYIRRSSAVSQGRFYGKPITYYKPTSKVAKDYMDLTNEMLKRMKIMEGI
jgi:chromosome partitioning protein